LKTKGEADDAAYDTLAKAMRVVIKNLEEILSPNDPRWLAFGLNMPGADTTPGQPLNVTASLGESGTITVQYDAVPLATRYRVRMRLVGVESDYRLVARSTEPMASISGVLPGQTAQIIVQAVNGAAQGVASEPILFTVPTVAKVFAPEPVAPATAATGASALEEPVVSSERNGHVNGSRLPALA